MMTKPPGFASSSTLPLEGRSERVGVHWGTGYGGAHTLETTYKHIYGANEWRDPAATQTFVLKNVVGNDLKVHTVEEFVSANTGRKLPRPQGDLIGETVQGSQGYLYYASATYSWYDPKTFTGPEAPPGVFHKRRTMR